MHRVATEIPCRTRDGRHVVEDSPFCVNCRLLVITFPEEPVPLATHLDKLEVIRLLVARDGLECFYCERALRDIEHDPYEDPSTSLQPDYPTIDHIIPRFFGGGSNLDNLALACPRCNRMKGHELVVLLDMVRRVRARNRDLAALLTNSDDLERTAMNTEEP